ncbi:DOMON-like domain-containing protein [Sphingobium sp. CR28]|uniref:DOMON-like domain-containing protein n=1 Tax=Sphingobium sp. CR28 TaxID=3400272 RepID=UPI003FEF56F1
MAKRALKLHPDSSALSVSIGTKLTMLGQDVLRIEYALVGELARIAIPAATIGERTDDLWQHSCFEAFLQLPGNGYVEYNFSPSGNWAAYQFEAYREGMQPSQPAPYLHVERDESRLGLTGYIELGALPAFPNAIGLSAVVEEKGGAKSYWALAHPPGKPDFHHEACFVAELPAPRTS